MDAIPRGGRERRDGAAGPGGVPYSVHPAVATLGASLRGLKSKTGRSLDEWIALVRRDGPVDVEGRREWLKARFGLGACYARWIVERIDGGAREDIDPKAYLAAAPRYVDEMFAGPRARLRPLYATMVESIVALGRDVRVCPRPALVPIYRRHVFAVIRPVGRRLELGLALRTTPGTARVVAVPLAARRDRITHKVTLAQREQVDDDLRRWVRAAYDLDA